MTDVVLVGGRRMRLLDRDLIGEGGEGRVYRARDLAVKVFTTPDANREQKLRAFPTQLPSRVVAPLELVTRADGSVIGFTMRALDNAVDVHRFAQRRWRAGHITNAAVLALFRELQDTLHHLHVRGIVVGDLNDGNVVATSDAGRWVPWLIDADSMQFGQWRCVVAHERFLDPRLYGVDLARQTALSRESDWYALAVLLFSALLYVHPFGGSHPSYGTLLRRAEARCSVLRPDVKLPDAVRPQILGDDALAWFERVFERDLREPLPTSVLEARFTKCSCGFEHARRTCPVCTAHVPVSPVVQSRGRLRATRIFATAQGRIVAAAVDGTLKYAWEHDGALFREDGSELVLSEGRSEEDEVARAFFRDPNRVTRIAGNSTWIGAGGRFSKIVSGRVVASIPVERVRGELAADAGIAGLLRVDGDTLVRAEDGSRLGRVLEAQTFVRTSACVGFAFYRAGPLTIAFVFDPRRGGLRQVERFPPIKGKLVGWSAFFDEMHVLVTFAAEEHGRTAYVAHLIDARGELIATDDSRHGGVLPRSLGGRTLAGGSVLSADDDDGLVLARADRNAARFVRSRVFADAKGLVSSDADLLVGPAGSIFVVTHDAIAHLDFS